MSSTGRGKARIPNVGDVATGPGWHIVHADCREAMAGMEPSSVDSIVSDPPYHLTQASRAGSPRKPGSGPFGRVRLGERGFMGRTWDGGGVAFDAAVWEAVLRVAKPGAHLVAFGGTRTWHRLVCAIEDAGWEIRDSLCWLFGSGFPKSKNVALSIDKARGHPNRGRAIPTASEFQHGTQEHLDANPVPEYEPRDPDARQWNGWGTALKPAHEPIILARKPLVGTVAANVLEHGTGGVNVGGCRVGTSKDVPASPAQDRENIAKGRERGRTGDTPGFDPNVGRWPANVILGCACEDEHESGCAVAMLDEQSGESRSRIGAPRMGAAGNGFGLTHTGAEYDDTGGASRFFYCAKASRAEREAGLSGLSLAYPDPTRAEGSAGRDNPRAGTGRQSKRRNQHPTVKPIALMRWLVRLVTPPGGLVLDPFCGSGSTGVACIEEGFRFVGIEQSDTDAEPFATIARARLAQARFEAQQIGLFGA